MEDYRKAMSGRLKARRKALRLTQAQMAEKLDISVKHYSEAERGLIGFSVENLIKVCDVLGLSLDYLLRGVSVDDAQGEAVPARILEIYRSCPDDKKPALLEILEAETRLF